MGRINYQSIKKKSEVRVLNYNVHHFAAAYDSYHKIDLNSLAAVILRDEVDIVTLQEVDVHTMRSGQYLNQVKVLAEKTGMFYAFGKTIDYEGGDYGIAILSKFPIVEQHFYKLPFVDNKEEKRGLLVCKIDLGEAQMINIGTTHLSSSNEQSRLLQTKRIAELQRESAFDFLTGDLNAEINSKPVEQLKTTFDLDSRFMNQMTIPAYKSDKKIDFMIRSINSTIKIIRQDTYQMNALSDHNLMISDITL